MTTQTTEGALLLDDGDFFLELNSNYPAADAPGFLLRRCYVGVTTPGGYECIGSFDRDPRGRWRASVDAPYDAATDSDARDIGVSRQRLDAIVALWGARHDAYCRHNSD